MNKLISKLRKARTDREVIQILVAEFKTRKHPKTKNDVSAFQRDLIRELPGVNRWVLTWNRKTGREIEDVIMDEFNIQGQ